MILREEITHLQGITTAFSVLGHNIPINYSNLLGARKRNEALEHSLPYVQNSQRNEDKKTSTQIWI